MTEKGEKILTRKRVDELGFDKLSVITADMLDGYTSIGDGAFYGCSSLASVTIPNSVTSIGNSAFYGCSSLTSVTIPNTVTSIGWGAFESCSGLTFVTIPNSITSIGNYVFYCCSGLTSVTIPNSVTSIGGGAFSYCSSLASIEIPNSVTRIGRGAFENCYNLISMTIPNNVICIGYSAFSNCNFLQKAIKDKQGRIIAYKGFNTDMTCRGFRYKEGETYKIKGWPILCERGFHACLNPLDCFIYYYGQIQKDVVFHEVYLDGVSDEKGVDSKVVAKKITIGREITLSEMADIASGRI